MLKRSIVLLVCTFMLFGLVACGGKTPDSSEPLSEPTDSSTPDVPTSDVSDSTQGSSSTDGTSDTTNNSGAMAGTTTKTPPKNNTTAPTSKTNPTDPVTPAKVVQSLNNTYYKLTVEKKLTVGYIGGSVTVGEGATDVNQTCWRALTTQWLQKNYPSATIQEANAAIGGSGSLLGACRVNDELLKNYKPDLIFAEFAINDHYQGYSYDESLLYMESFVRIILKNSPNTDVVFVYTTDSGFRGKAFDAVLAFETVAKHYGLYSINVGNELAKREGYDALATAGKYLTDIVHPNDAGHAKYASYISEFLAAQFQKCEKNYSPHSIPTPIRSDVFEKTTLISGADILASNSSLQGVGDLNTIRGTIRLPGGGTFTVKFKGKALAMRWRSEADAVIALRLDKKASTMPIGSLNGAQQILFSNLSNTEHTLQVLNKGSSNCLIYGLYILE